MPPAPQSTNARPTGAATSCVGFVPTLLLLCYTRMSCLSDGRSRGRPARPGGREGICARGGQEWTKEKGERLGHWACGPCGDSCVGAVGEMGLGLEGQRIGVAVCGRGDQRAGTAGELRGVG